MTVMVIQVAVYGEIYSPRSNRMQALLTDEQSEQRRQHRQGMGMTGMPPMGG